MTYLSEFLTECLKEKGYGGLWSNDCACDVNDLMPCCEVTTDCQPAYRVPCTHGGKDGCKQCEANDLSNERCYTITKPENKL
jgi:hypothetical protein